MSIDNISLNKEPHPLRDEPLPVRIPDGVFKYPREWCLNDGHPPPAGRIPLKDICAMESRLEDFKYISQGVLLHLFFKLTDGRDVIHCNGRSIRYMKFFHLAKYGSKRDARLQEDALRMIKEAAEKHGMVLGDVKTLFYVASRHGRSTGIMGGEEHELYEVQRCRVLLNTGYFSGELAVFDWGGDLKQFKPVFEKALEYYEEVVMPDWCCKS